MRMLLNSLIYLFRHNCINVDKKLLDINLLKNVCTLTFLYYSLIEIIFLPFRARPDKACMLTVSNAHDTDVNVINWNANEPFIASGGDEGHLKIWDLRNLDKGQVNNLDRMVKLL